MHPRDETSQRSLARVTNAPVTRAIVVVNVAVFAIQVLMTRNISALWQMPPSVLLAAGANYAVATLAAHRYETLVTACFVHSGVLHLAFNMFVLWKAGGLAERNVGSARMAYTYLVAGTMSSLASAVVGGLTNPERQSVGASGAIAGMVAAALVAGWRAEGWRGPLTRSMTVWLAFVLGVQALMGLGDGGTDNAAHLGGALSGALVAACWRRGHVYSMRARNLVLAACATVAAACALVVLVRDVTDPYVTLRADERMARFEHGMRFGRCDEAYAALRSVERLYPQRRTVMQARGDFEARCGRPM